jgi:hypothetical protein
VVPARGCGHFGNETVAREPALLTNGGLFHVCANLGLQGSEERRERERRKASPKRLALVKQIADQHPEWGSEEIQRLHDDLEAWGE